VGEEVGGEGKGSSKPKTLYWEIYSGTTKY